MVLKAPFPWAGGKSAVASIIWARLGDVPTYVEPFMGSLAVLLARPHVPRIETCNDSDGLLCNAYRSIQFDPEQVAHYADWPVSEACLHAKHSYLIKLRGELTERLMGDPDYYDAKAAGYWIWGASSWIGSGWCSGRGPWQVVDGRLVNTGPAARAASSGVERKRPHLMTEGKGVVAKVRHLGDHGRGINRPGVVVQVHHPGGEGVANQIPFLGHQGKGVHAGGIHKEGVSRQAGSLSAEGQGVNRQLPQLRHGGSEYTLPTMTNGIYAWMGALSERLRRVRICCGDWTRILGPAGTTQLGVTGCYLDPPYQHEGRDTGLYTQDDADTWDAARAWAIEHGNDRRWRIVLSGYADDPASVMPAGWTWHTWASRGGYGNQGEGRGKANRQREVLWFSPHVLAAQQMELFAQEVPGG